MLNIARVLHRSSALILSLSLFLLCACQGYDFTVNDRVVYSPQPLFANFDVPDPALRACLEQAIADASATAAVQLNDLNCSHAGIGSLEGLSIFTGLSRLRLSSNTIRNLVELDRLIALRELYLDGNRVIDPVPLYQLSALQVVDLSGNPGLQCPRSGSFAGVETVILPEHCR